MSAKFLRLKTKWLVISGLLILLVLGVLSGVIRFEKVLQGKFCIRCAARQDSYFCAISIFKWRISLPTTTKITLSALSHSWDEFAGGCSHDWTFLYEDRLGSFGGYYADGFPNHRYPVGNSTEELVEGIRWCDAPEARLAALNAIGNRDNLLRFVAAETLRSVGSTNRPASLKFAEWWLANSNRFVVCTNISEAEVVLNTLEHIEDAALNNAVELSRDLLKKDR